MIAYFRSRRAALRARRLYELARIESLMAENQARIDEIERREAEGCLLCKLAGVS